MRFRKTATNGPVRTRRVVAAVSTALVATAASGLALVGSAQAAPIVPGGPDIPGVPTIPLPALPAPQLPGVPQIPGVPTPPEKANFSGAEITPGNGAVVGVAEPIIINFNKPISDHARAERSIRVTTTPPVSGAFHWEGDKQVRWRPQNLWPAHTKVTVDAGDSHDTFTVGDAFVATADDATHMITVTRDGKVIRTMPTSMGKPGHETPNGTYTVGKKFRTIIMDSSTYGVPVKSPQGYRLPVDYATRISYDGIFVHSAPWSVWAQGKKDTSHGCLNVSPADAKWYFDNVKQGDAVIVKNSKGQRGGNDGLTDFSMPWSQWAD